MIAYLTCLHSLSISSYPLTSASMKPVSSPPSQSITTSYSLTHFHRPYCLKNGNLICLTSLSPLSSTRNIHHLPLNSLSDYLFLIPKTKIVFYHNHSLHSSLSDMYSKNSCKISALYSCEIDIDFITKKAQKIESALFTSLMIWLNAIFSHDSFILLTIIFTLNWEIIIFDCILGFYF